MLLPQILNTATTLTVKYVNSCNKLVDKQSYRKAACSAAIYLVSAINSNGNCLLKIQATTNFSFQLTRLEEKWQVCAHSQVWQAVCALSVKNQPLMQLHCTTRHYINAHTYTVTFTLSKCACKYAKKIYYSLLLHWQLCMQTKYLWLNDVFETLCHQTGCASTQRESRKRLAIKAQFAGIISGARALVFAQHCTTATHSCIAVKMQQCSGVARVLPLHRNIFHQIART